MSDGMAFSTGRLPSRTPPMIRILASERSTLNSITALILVDNTGCIARRGIRSPRAPKKGRQNSENEPKVAIEKKLT